MPKKKSINKTIKIGKISFIALILILLASLTASAITKFQVMPYWIIGLGALGLICILLITYSIIKSIYSTSNWLNEGV